MYKFMSTYNLIHIEYKANIIWRQGNGEHAVFSDIIEVAYWKRKAGRKGPARRYGAHEEGSVRKNAIRREYPETTCAEGC